MLEPGGPLLAGLLIDAAPGSADALAAHARHRDAGYADALGPLLVRDDQLAEVGRHWSQRAATPLPVMVITTSGAGGLLSLARRAVPGVRVVAVESVLRDLDDLSGNVARVVAAAAELDDSVDVVVGLPHERGWVEAAAEVEAAGLSASITGGDPGRLADQLSVLIEADLPFSIHTVSGPVAGNSAGAQRSAGLPVVPPVVSSIVPPLVPLLVAVEALIEGAEPAEAAAVLRRGTDRERDLLAERVRGWDRPTQLRIRRRLLRLAVTPVTGPIDELVRARLLGSE